MFVALAKRHMSMGGSAVAQVFKQVGINQFIGTSRIPHPASSHGSTTVHFPLLPSCCLTLASAMIFLNFSISKDRSPTAAARCCIRRCDCFVQESCMLFVFFRASWRGETVSSVDHE
jgi:hypothetical protein